MVRDNIDYKAMLKFVRDRISTVSTHIFTTSRPKAEVPTMDDFVVISMPSRVYDRYGFGSTTVRVSLYAKDINNQEAVVKLGTMQRAVYALLPYSNDVYAVTEPYVISGGTDGNGYHILHINYTLTVKK